MNKSITCEFYGKPDPLIKWYKYQNGVQKEIGKYFIYYYKTSIDFVRNRLLNLDIRLKIIKTWFQSQTKRLGWR